MLFQNKLRRGFLSPAFIIIAACVAFFVLVWATVPFDSEMANAAYKSLSLNKPKTSRVHNLIWASRPVLPFCTGLASKLANRYPIPTMLGYDGPGKYNLTGGNNIAKLHTLQRYLYGPAGAHDDDLVIATDGYDVLAQLPVDVFIERYFDTAARADKHLADRFGITVEEAHSRSLRQTVFFSAGKLCFPRFPDEAQCWALPPSHLPHNIFGPKREGVSETSYADPIWVNAGIMIGPVGDLRKVIDAALGLVAEIYDPKIRHINSSDQYYIGKVMGRQEVYRTKELTGGWVPGLTGTRVLPKEKQNETDQTEFYMSVDHEHGLVQNRAINEVWLRKLNFKLTDHSALVLEDVLNDQGSFKPYRIQMPSYVFLALRRIFDSISDTIDPRPTAKEWIGSLKLGTNVATRQTFAFFHQSGPKTSFMEYYQEMWYFPFLQRMLKAAVEANRAREPLTSRLIDGRNWVSQTNYPEDESLHDAYGGAFADSTNEFIPFRQLCGEYTEGVFGAGNHEASINN
ncbi:hypothetical protein EDB81DRAFT_457116 [Dactylonectria macrodidyma]|uniref:Uncharacterized protein n=1 Tax=Dactylonectria macrodidyma TaxID=307937 RepID=A0A9P9J8P1_9HYPO|nr:hypothetical protein EDB81DRAFT_457116 [Dactylonectria macrodidyma]